MDMTQIAIELPKEAYLPGELVAGKVRLFIEKPVKARSVKLRIVGLEETHITVSDGDDSHTYREYNYMLRNDIILHGPQFEKNLILQSGNYVFDFDFKLPDTALPSYKGINAEVSYKVEARVDIPLWFDVVDKRPFYVFRDRGALKFLKQPLRYWSENVGDPTPDKPGFVVDITKRGFVAGEVIEGTVSLRNIHTRSLRGIYVQLLGIEFARASNTKEEHTIQKIRIEIPVHDMMEGVPKIFFLSIPRDAVPSYEGMFSNFRWAVEVGLDVPLAFDVKALHPVEILR